MKEEIFMSFETITLQDCYDAYESGFVIYISNGLLYIEQNA